MVAGLEWWPCGGALIMPTFFIALVSLLAVGFIFVIYGTLAKNKWGINPASASCPRCNTALPQARKPRSLRQCLWGGWTCPNCGVEVDKWGRELPA
jgi:hypothetical protein